MRAGLIDALNDNNHLSGEFLPDQFACFTKMSLTLNNNSRIQQNNK